MGEQVRARTSVIARQGQEAVFKQAQIDKLTHENALLKRMKFAAKSERFSAEQKSLLEESLDEDLAGGGR
jgi:transposase